MSGLGEKNLLLAPNNGGIVTGDRKHVFVVLQSTDKK